MINKKTAYLVSMQFETVCIFTGNPTIIAYNTLDLWLYVPGFRQVCLFSILIPLCYRFLLFNAALLRFYLYLAVIVIPQHVIYPYFAELYHINLQNSTFFVFTIYKENIYNFMPFFQGISIIPQ